MSEVRQMAEAPEWLWERGQKPPPDPQEARRKSRLALKERILDEFDMLNHPKGDALFNVAWADVKERSPDTEPTYDELCARMECLSQLVDVRGDGTGDHDTVRSIIGTRERKELMYKGAVPRLVTTKFQVFTMDGTIITVSARIRLAGEQGPSLHLDVTEDKP